MKAHLSICLEAKRSSALTKKIATETVFNKYHTLNEKISIKSVGLTWNRKSDPCSKEVEIEKIQARIKFKQNTCPVRPASKRRENKGKKNGSIAQPLSE